MTIDQFFDRLEGIVDRYFDRVASTPRPIQRYELEIELPPAFTFFFCCAGVSVFGLGVLAVIEEVRRQRGTT